MIEWSDIGLRAGATLVLMSFAGFVVLMGVKTASPAPGKFRDFVLPILRDWRVWIVVVPLFVLLFSDAPGLTSWTEDNCPESGCGLLWHRWEFSDFWARHTVWANVVVTILLAGLALFGWSLHDRQRADAEVKRQQALATGVSAVGLGGLVDSLVDAEVLLAFAWSGDHATARDVLVQDRESSLFPTPDDLRRYRSGIRSREHYGIDVRRRSQRKSTPPPPDDPIWRIRFLELAAQILADGMAHWAPLVAQSTYGSLALQRLSEVRTLVLHVLVETRQAEQGWGRRTTSAERDASLAQIVGRNDHLHCARSRLRFYALFFECVSLGGELSGEPDSTPAPTKDVLTELPVRPYVIGTLHDGLHSSQPADGYACMPTGGLDTADKASLPEEWRRAWDGARAQLGRRDQAYKDVTLAHKWRQSAVDSRRLVLVEETKAYLPTGSMLTALDKGSRADPAGLFVKLEATTEVAPDEGKRASFAVFLHKSPGAPVPLDHPLVTYVSTTFDVLQTPAAVDRWNTWLTLHKVTSVWMATEIEVLQWLDTQLDQLCARTGTVEVES